jgi:hypothetical protein
VKWVRWFLGMTQRVFMDSADSTSSPQALLTTSAGLNGVDRLLRARLFWDETEAVRRATYSVEQGRHFAKCGAILRGVI